MTIYERDEQNRKRMEKAKEIALAAAGAVGALAWTIAQNVIVEQGTRAANDATDKWRNRDKKKQDKKK